MYFSFLFQGIRDGSGDVSPKDTKPSDLVSEADSIDGRTSGQLGQKTKTYKSHREKLMTQTTGFVKIKLYKM